jgi:hypothetical protein
MTDGAASSSAERCGQPVTVAAAFTPVITDTGHTCLRAAGHEGIHRWSAKWETVPPAQVEADLAAEYEKWDKDEE